MTLRTPAAWSIFVTATPAAPTPVTTTFTSSIRLPTTRSALRNAASTTTAVPCWSSWKTGMSSEARSRSSTSKQRGAEMSSRLMPPKPGAIASTAATILSGSFVSRQIGHASTPPNSLNSSALPSITGIAASGPMSPRPSTALPSVTTATVLRLIVRLHALSGSAAIAWQTRATPGVYAIDRSSRVFTGAFESMWILPPRCSRNVRSETRSTATPGTSRQASDDRSACAASVASTLTSRILLADSTRTRSIASSSPPASAIARARSAKLPGRSSRRTRRVRLNEAE